MTEQAVLVTGSNGAIGQALCRKFSDSGWRVFATDIQAGPSVAADHYFELDLERYVVDEVFRQQFQSVFLKLLPEGLDCLINNAAYQSVGAVEKIAVGEWARSLNVNVTAPFLLVRDLLGLLDTAGGNIINITSVHARLTKPNFSAYATSKAALEGLTRSLAVEIGDRIRVNAIAPAAIATPMLEAGFKDSREKLDALAYHHPTGQLGSPNEVASLAVFIAKSGNSFINGSIIGLDGGIASRLHDPA